MNFESIPEQEVVEIESNDYFSKFVPDDFRIDPFLYFEKEGKRIKEGDVKFDEEGKVREDPTAVVDFPEWKNDKGESVEIVAKRVNTEKAQISRENDPFYEYRVMEIVRHLNLPCPAPILKVRKGSDHMIVMEKAKGFRLVGKDLEELKSKLKPEQIPELKKKAEDMMLELKEKLESFGIKRGFKLTDMIYDLDFSDTDIPSIKSMTPVDWERTKIDMDKLSETTKDL